MNKEINFYFKGNEKENRNKSESKIDFQNIEIHSIADFEKLVISKLSDVNLTEEQETNILS